MAVLDKPGVVLKPRMEPRNEFTSPPVILLRALLRVLVTIPLRALAMPPSRPPQILLGNCVECRTATYSRGHSSNTWQCMCHLGPLYH